MDKTSLEYVIETDTERTRLLDLEKQLVSSTHPKAAEQLKEVYLKLEEIDAFNAETKAAKILEGLGFTHEMMNRATTNLSGGWRMRVAIARALFVEPGNFLFLSKKSKIKKIKKKKIKLN
jgi:ATPase subunit of ABC transporter with duplicated ATPase domains